MAAIAWFIDCAVALVWQAWDGVRPAQPNRPSSSPLRRIDLWPLHERQQAQPRLLARPGRFAAFLIASVAVSLSIAGLVTQQSGGDPEATTSPAAAAASPSPTTHAVSRAGKAELLTFRLPDESTGDPTVTAAAVAPTNEPTAAPTIAPTVPPPAVTPAQASSAPQPTATPKPEPTQAPAPALPATPPQPPGTLTEAEVRTYATAAGWPHEHLDRLVEVVWCESRFSPSANSGYYLGLLQIDPWWFTNTGTDLTRWSDPVTNLSLGLVIFRSSGWGAWPNC